jgi:hypothetical protein
VPERAQILSVEALEAFRANLIVYLHSARPALDEVRGEIIRSRVWLETDRQPYWEAQIRRRAQRLQDAEAELFKIRLSPLSSGLEYAQAMVRRGREALAEAEAKLKAVRKWIRDFDLVFGPGMRQVELLRERLSADLNEAVADLTRITQLLADYSNVAPPTPVAPKTTEDAP